MMSRQKIKGQKRAKPRAYYPFKATAASNTKLSASIQDEALNIILGKASFPTYSLSLKSLLGDIQNCEHYMQKDVTPCYSKAYCKTHIPSISMDCSGHGSTSSTCEDDDPSSPARSKRPLSPLTFGEGCNTNNVNLMEFLSPDPIAPDHPLSKKKGSSSTLLNEAISTTIDDIVHDDDFFHISEGRIPTLSEQRRSQSIFLR
mmetsp:Transcript_7205/g.17618  ORF Transcript_7205/g.17618 Transcript_7205/m.17618 type:complete len:202 (-) Transcript_7205:1422-2027(-)